MSNMKCPFCQQELRKIHPTYVICDNCRISGEYILWKALADTKKKLDIAVDSLETISLKEHKTTPSIFLIKYAQKTIEQIKDNDKDVK